MTDQPNHPRAGGAHKPRQHYEKVSEHVIVSKRDDTSKYDVIHKEHDKENPNPRVVSGHGGGHRADIVERKDVKEDLKARRRGNKFGSNGIVEYIPGYHGDRIGLIGIKNLMDKPAIACLIAFVAVVWFLSRGRQSIPNGGGLSPLPLSYASTLQRNS